MQESLLAGLSKEDREKVKECLLHSQVSFDIIKSVLGKRLESLAKNPVQDYDCPSWALKQADKLGEERGLKYVMALLTL